MAGGVIIAVAFAFFLIGLLVGHRAGQKQGWSNGAKWQTEWDKSTRNAEIERLKFRARNAALNAVSDVFDAFTDEMERQAK